MDKIVKTIAVIAMLVIIIAPLNAKAASIEVTIPGTYVNQSTGQMMVRSRVKNNTNASRYATNHLYRYTRAGAYCDKASTETCLGAGKTCLADIAYSPAYKYMCKGSLYNSGAPESGTAYVGNAYFLWD